MDLVKDTFWQNRDNFVTIVGATVATGGQYANHSSAINKTSVPTNYVPPLLKRICYINVSKGGFG